MKWLMLVLFYGLWNACVLDKAKEAVEDVKSEIKSAKSELKGNVSNLKKTGSEQLEDFKVVAQDLVDSSIQYIDVDANGNFSLDLDSLSSVALTILDDNSSVSAIVKAGTSIGLSALDSLVDLGNLEFSGDKVVDLAAAALNSIEPNDLYTIGQEAAASLGFGTGGSGGPTFDRDKDGVIDLFDVDLDNNGILNDQDVEDLLLKASRLGPAAEFIANIELTTSLVTEYKMPEAERMKQAGLNLKVFPLMGATLDSILITGPDFLTGTPTEWRYMCNTCPGDNRPYITEGGVPVKGKMILAQDGGQPQWQALVGDQSNTKSMSLLKPGDVIVFHLYKDGVHIPVLRSVSWVFRKTPTLYQIADANGTVLYTQADIEAFATRPMEDNPAIDSNSSVVFTVDMMRGITDADNLPLKGFDDYEIQFMQEGTVGGQPQQHHVANITNNENAQYLNYLESQHQLEVTIPNSFLKTAQAGMQVTGYKIDLGMYDRSRNKTVMQIRLNILP